MKIKDYEKVRKLLRSKEKLNQLDEIFNHPCISLFYNILKNFSFFNRLNGEEIPFYSLDEQTQEELEESIKQVIHKRLKEIDEEIENI